jgi:uncharacterized protein (TIRG00374 family)
MTAQASKNLGVLKNNMHKDHLISRDFALRQVKPRALSENSIQEFGVYKLVLGGLIFILLTVGIFWYQFSEIPAGDRPPIWNQLNWRYLLWLLLFLPVDTFSAGLRIWVICRVLQPGVSFWTCLKAEWANLGLAMLTPSQTGGGFGQIYVLNRGGVSLGTALTVSLISFFGSMVILLFIGFYFFLIAEVNHLGFIFQWAFLIFFLVFAALTLVVCWPGSLRFAVLSICNASGKICDKSHPQDDKCLPHNTRMQRLTRHLNNVSEKLIDLCYSHQANMRRFFNLKKTSFIWVCLLSFAFMVARSIMAFFCLRFLGIQAPTFGNVLETQLNLIFLIYFAPTPGSSGLAEGASMLMMQGAIPTGFVPYYNLLWRCSTLYLPAIAGLVFLSWTILQDARRVVGR